MTHADRDRDRRRLERPIVDACCAAAFVTAGSVVGGLLTLAWIVGLTAVLCRLAG